MITPVIHRYARLLLLLILLPAGSFIVRGQTAGAPLSYVDSLTAAAKTGAHDTVKIRALYELSHYWSDRDTLKALQYVRQGMKMSEKFPQLRAMGYFYLAGCYFDTDMALSQKYYLLSDSLLRNFENPEAYTIRSRAWHNYGVLKQHQNDEKAFADIIIAKAIPLAEKAKDTLRIARHYCSLGIIFSNQLDYSKAIDYFKMAEGVFEKGGATDYDRLELYLKLARNYILLKDYAKTFPYITKVQAILKNDPSSPFLPEYYLIEGMYRAGIGDHQSAIASLTKGIEIAPEVHRDMDIQSLTFEKYKSLRELKRYPEAAKTLGELIKESNRYRDNSRNLLLQLFHMSEVQALMGNYKNAYDWLLRFSIAADSIKVENMSTEIADLEAKYQSTEKEKQILRLQSQNEKAALTIKNNRLLNWLFGSISFFLLIVSGLALLFYRNSRKLLEHQRHVHELEVHRMKQDQRIMMFSSMLEGQEQERTRLARDLHDGLGGLLSGIKIELSQVNPERPDESRQNLSRTIQHLDNAVNELRRIARSLMPELLMKYGLAEATREFCKNLNIAGKTSVICQVFNYSEKLSQEKQIVLYRIIQELVNNALKHADATQILVLLQQRDDILFITVEDDGKGFDVPDAEVKNGSGIANLKARAEFLNASIDIQSSPKTGTTVTIECPV